jgi:hypothetical protein
MTDPAAPREQPASNSLALEAVRRNPIVRIILVVLPAVISSLAAYTGAAGDARDRAQVVKEKAANVYQVTRESVADLQERVVELTDRIAALERAVRLARAPKASRTAAAPVTPPAAPAPAPAPAPLPATFDKAAEAPPPAAPPEPAK